MSSTQDEPASGAKLINILALLVRVRTCLTFFKKQLPHLHARVMHRHVDWRLVSHSYWTLRVYWYGCGLTKTWRCWDISPVRQGKPSRHFPGKEAWQADAGSWTSTVQIAIQTLPQQCYFMSTVGEITLKDLVKNLEAQSTIACTTNHGIRYALVRGSRAAAQLQALSETEPLVGSAFPMMVKLRHSRRLLELPFSAWLPAR